MTREQLLALCGRIADRFNLNDWLLRFSIEEAPGDDPNAWGHCTVIYGRKVAYIAISEAVLDRDLETAKHVIAHELTHVHLNAVRESMRQLMEPLSSDMRHSIDSVLTLEMERATDSLSVVVANLLPGEGEAGESEVPETA